MTPSRRSAARSVSPGRRTQAERRAATRDALLEAATRGLSHHGYGALVLEQVASEAGYTRGALYHLFNGKEELALAVVAWVSETWEQEVGCRADAATDPVDALLAVARGHAIYCRQDMARVMMVLSVEFSGRDHPIGRAVLDVVGDLVDRCTRLVLAGRRSGAIPPGPPARTVALAFLGAIEGLAIQVAGKRPHDVVLAERTARGLLGLAP